ALAALLLPPRGRDELRRTSLDLAREREGAATHLAEAPVRLDAARDVDAAVARGLRPPDETQLVERLVHDRRALLRLGQAPARLGVDVDAELVGMLDVAPSGRPGVEVDGGEIGSPRDLRELGHAELVGGATGGEGDGRRLDPVRAVLRHSLLVDRLALGSV